MLGMEPVKAEELHALDADELTSRLKGARRELYELRFKLAVGQLDDHRQVRKVRKDIARILTVVHTRRLALLAGEEFPGAEHFETKAEPAALEPAVTVDSSEPGQDAPAAPQNEETPEDVETAGEAEPVPPARKPRRRDAVGEEANDD